jgi:hypothetical protein
LASINAKNIKLGAKGKFQIVLVGYDRDAAGNKGYLEKGGMNFPAVKIADKERLENLTKKGETGFIPNIVLLKPDGTMVSNKKEEVMKKLTELAGG